MACLVVFVICGEHILVDSPWVFDCYGASQAHYCVDMRRTLMNSWAPKSHFSCDPAFLYSSDSISHYPKQCLDMTSSEKVLFYYEM